MVETEVIRKVRIRLLPFLFVLYIVAFLDRINIGFAALTMNRDLALTAQQFGLAVGIFFFGYCLFEIPSNLILYRIGARKWIARILISWGVIAMATGFVRTAPELYIARFLLGLAEAGFFPGILLYLTFWFPVREQARAIALFMIALPVATMIGAPLSGTILDHVNWMNLGGWRWLMILEGCPAVVLGALVYIMLPNNPREAVFLSGRERAWLTASLDEEAATKQNRFQLDAARALKHAGVWLLASIGLARAIGFYSFVFWTPQAVKDFAGPVSNTQVGFLIAAPQLVGLLAMLVVARSSDCRLERKYHMTVPLLLGAIGLILLSTVHSTAGSMLLLSLASIGVYGAFGPYLASASSFLTRLSAATGLALITSVANLGGFAGPYVVGVISRMTGNIQTGFIFAGISMLFCAALCLLLPNERPFLASKEIDDRWSAEAFAASEADVEPSLS